MLSSSSRSRFGKMHQKCNQVAMRRHHVASEIAEGVGSHSFSRSWHHVAWKFTGEAASHSLLSRKWNPLAEHWRGGGSTWSLLERRFSHANRVKFSQSRSTPWSPIQINCQIQFHEDACAVLLNRLWVSRRKVWPRAQRCEAHCHVWLLLGVNCL